MMITQMLWHFEKRIASIPYIYMLQPSKSLSLSNYYANAHFRSFVGLSYEKEEEEFKKGDLPRSCCIDCLNQVTDKTFS